MDVSDQATVREEQERDRVLQQRRPAGPPPNGRCLYCGEILGDEQRWCDAEHRDLWEAEHVRR